MLRAGDVPADVDADIDNDRYWVRGVGLVSASDLFSTSRASTKYVTTASGILVSLGANVFPRSDKGSLLEVGKTNNLVQSRDFSANWSKPNFISGSTVAGPDPLFNVVALVPTTTSASHYLKADSGLNIVTFTSGQYYTWSIYFKPAGYNILRFEKPHNTPFPWTTAIQYDASTDTWSNTGGLSSWSSELLANGWRRLKFSALAAATQAGVPAFGAIYINVYGSFAGDGTSGVYLANAQMENSAYATSYIPTTASTAVRASDNITLLGLASSMSLSPAGSAFFSARVNGFGTAGESVPRSIGFGASQTFGSPMANGSNGRWQAWNGTASLSSTGVLADWTTGVRNAVTTWDATGRTVTMTGSAAVTSDANPIGNNGASTAYLGSNNGGNMSSLYLSRAALWRTRLSDAAALNLAA